MKSYEYFICNKNLEKETLKILFSTHEKRSSVIIKDSVLLLRVEISIISFACTFKQFKNFRIDIL